MESIGEYTIRREAMKQALLIKKELSDYLKKEMVIEENSAGQLTLHINNGGITKICRNNWEIK